MPEFFKFAEQNPYLVFWFAVIVCMLVTHLVWCVIFKLPNRFLRHRNIMKNGYPPPHCDADGDFKPLPEKDDDE